METTRLPSTALYEEIRQPVLAREDVRAVSNDLIHKKFLSRVSVAFPAGDVLPRDAFPILYATVRVRSILTSIPTA
ncbi:jg6577 [Pararge aegeria aegeria]|uniref:Jg6577 protein n=1 Tax=Pararge aegeria aegeria TaxID=348720 RepID=A0A8S4RB34_9NEOP|nr:jg6577 [Pararge aegeria aegeria]